MKKNFILLFILLGISLGGFAQSSVVWKNAVFDKSNIAKSLYRDNNGNVYSCILDKGPMNIIKGMFINKYSPDLDFITKIDFSGSLPKDLQVGFVKDYICIFSKGEGILFYDYLGNLVKKVALDEDYRYSIIEGNWASAILNNNYSHITNTSNLTTTKDLKNITIWGYKKIGNPKNKLDKNNSIKFYAFDNKLEKIAEETFDFEDVFTGSAEINSLKFDLTPQNKVIALCSNVSKPDQAKVWLAVFNEPGKNPLLYKYSFKFDAPSIQYDFGKMNEIFISGIVSEGGFRPSLKRTPDKVLYFINQSLKETKPVSPVTYNLEDQIYNTYSNYASKLKTTSLDPFGIFVMEDGIMFGAMQLLEVTSSSTSTTGNMMSTSTKTTYYSKSFTFIKFSFSGKIQWLKMINKEVRIPDGYQKAGGFSFVKEDNKLKVIYIDNPANIINKSKKMVSGYLTKCVPAYAEITSGGDITITPVDKIIKKKMIYYPDESIIYDKNILMQAVKIRGLFNLDYFIGKAMLP